MFEFFVFDEVAVCFALGFKFELVIFGAVIGVDRLKISERLVHSTFACSKRVFSRQAL